MFFYQGALNARNVPHFVGCATAGGVSDKCGNSNKNISYQRDSFQLRAPPNHRIHKQQKSRNPSLDRKMIYKQMKMSRCVIEHKKLDWCKFKQRTLPNG